LAWKAIFKLFEILIITILYAYIGTIPILTLFLAH